MPLGTSAVCHLEPWKDLVTEAKVAIWDFSTVVKKIKSRARREKNGFGVTDENGYFSNDASRAEKKKERRIKGRY